MTVTPPPLPSPTPVVLTMAERIAAELEKNPLAHEWIVAAEVRLDTRTARRAAFRQSYRTIGGERVDALDVYCRRCRRPLDEVADADCAAKVDNTHLIGGNPGERAKRKIPEVVGQVERVQMPSRRNMQYGGYSVHAEKV